ncbi:ROK family protein [Ammoniphilus sp. 3BR4]|uniref:ROK family protein n=1 Tax=Ammoniphilus sp. 3BR4 TaxID=3158265 RepID=UPI00346670BD
MIPLFKEPFSQKVNSLKQLYRLIFKHGPITKGSLIELTGMKQSTCTRLIEELLQENVILESGLAESSGGRKPLMYQINPKLYYLIGIDISRIHSKILLMDLQLTILAEVKMTMRQDSTPELTIQWIRNQINHLLQQHEISTNSVLGIGIGAVGPLNREDGIIMNPLNFPSVGWKDVPICKILHEHFNLPVLLDNGANTAVLGEYINGFWRDSDSMVYNLTGVGIRCGILTHGQVNRGPVDMEGAYGHTTVDLHGRQCSCGKYGCLNAYATILAIQEEVIRGIKRGRPSLLKERGLDMEQIEFSDICWAVKEGDPLCRDVVRDAAYYYGIGLANLMFMLHPDIVLLGGPLVTELDYFYQVSTEIALEKMQLYPDYPVRFSRGKLGENAVAVGAGSMVFESFLR